MSRHSQNLELTQKTGMRLSQQQVRYTRMLELNAPELDEAVERELEDNPALTVKEESEPIAPETGWRGIPVPARGEDYSAATPDHSETLYDHLLAQISERKLSVPVETAARFIIGSLDSNGYLTRTVREITDDLAFGPGIDVSEGEVREALAAVRSLDPPGIGASNLRECLRIQLEALPESDRRDVALRIIGEAYEAFTMKHKHRIVSALKDSPEEIDSALELILSLNPKPGAALGNDPTDTARPLVPDFIVTNEEGELRIQLNNRIPELAIDTSFEQAMDRLRENRGERKGSEFITSRYADARDFIRILSQRQQTMLKVMTAIVAVQKDYFLTEDIYRLKPMMIKNLAEMTGLDLSVISRVTSNKSVALPWGVLPLRFFFSDAIGGSESDAERATNRKIEARIKTLIENEDKRHPLSDQKIMEKMGAEGYDLSRRTVAKYRDRQGIPVARLRKEL